MNYVSCSILEKESTVAKLQSEVKTFEVRIKKVQEELDSQKAKNDVSSCVFFPS